MDWSNEYCRDLVSNMQLEVATVRCNYLVSFDVRNGIERGLSWRVEEAVWSLVGEATMSEDADIDNHLARFVRLFK